MSSKWSLFDHLVGGYKPCEFPVGMDLDSPPARPNALARDRDARQRHRAHVHRHRARLSRAVLRRRHRRYLRDRLARD